MRAAYIGDLAGHFGPVSASGLWNTVARYALDKLYLPISQATMSDLDYIQAKTGNTPGLMIDPVNWYGVTGAAAADRAHQELNRIGFSGANVAKPCSLMFDYERHSIQDILDLLTRWRQLRSKRDTQLTFEPLQGGWMTDSRIVSLVNNDINLVLLPQTYRSLMQPVAQDAVWRDLRWYPDGSDAFASNRIKIFYGCFWRDANGIDHLIPPGERMDGCLWTMDKLYALST